MIFLLSLSGCGTGKSARAPRGPEVNLLRSSENERTYETDYDTTFRAAVDSLRELDNTSAKLVKYNDGIIMFKKPDDAGAVTAYVAKLDEQTTRVKLVAKTKRKFLPNQTDIQIRDAFFTFLERRLSPPAEKMDQTKAEREMTDQPQEPPDSGASAKKAAHVASIRKFLGLDEEADFLERLEYDELTTLQQRVESLYSASQEKTGVAQRCAACYIDLARIYHDSQQYARAAEALKIAIRVDPENAVAHCNLGEIYKHLELYEDAVRELTEAQRLNPELPDVYINLGIIYDDHLVDDDKALEYYKKYLELGGADQQVYGWIREIEESAGS